MTHVFFISSVSAFCAAAILIPLAARLAVKAGFVDMPGGRKRHKHPVPPIGGLVIFPVFTGALNVWHPAPDSLWPLYLSLGVLLAVGALDDYRHIKAWIKFLAQFIAAFIIVIAGKARLFQLGNLFGFGDIGLDFISIPFSVVAIVLLINAVNLLDGLDGLAGGYGFTVFFWLILACLLAGAYQPLLALGPFIGALAGFLIYNLRTFFRHRASVFLGDAGSMALGLVIAWFAIDLAQAPGAVFEPIAVAWILALPIMDICAQFNRRIREGRHPFSPDRRHFHHYLIEAGFSPARAVAVIIALAFMLGAIGVLGLYFGLPQWILTLIWIALLFTHMTLSRRPARYILLIKRLSVR